MSENKKYVICGCVEKEDNPVLCEICNFRDDKKACEEEERVHYLYKEV